jgi:hypothetical protein
MDESLVAPKRERNYWIDLGRLLMAFFVVGIHATRKASWAASINEPLTALNPVFIPDGGAILLHLHGLLCL